MTRSTLSDTALDRMQTAHQAEFDLWSVRRRAADPTTFELVRRAGPHDEDITRLTKRECRDKVDAVMWLNTYRGRAAIQAALEAE